MMKKLVQQNDLISGSNNLLSSQIFKYLNIQLKKRKTNFSKCYVLSRNICFMGNTLSEALCCIDMMKKLRIKAISNSAKKKEQMFLKILSDLEHSFQKEMSVLEQYVCLLRKKEKERDFYSSIVIHLDE